MSWISLACFAISVGIVLSVLRHGADPLSPARVFGLVWSLSIGLVEFKFSAFQHNWNPESWVLLLTGISAFLVGTFIAYVLNVETKLVPVRTMRKLLRQEEVDERRLFWIIFLSVAVYSVSYLVIFFVKGWLPIFAVGRMSRVDWYVFGFGVLINSTAFIVFFTVLYHVMVPDKKKRKIVLTTITLVTVGSYFLLLQRFQIIMAAVICFTLIYYATSLVRLKTALPLVSSVVAFFFWISSLRLGNLIASYTYMWSKMRFPRGYAFFTEPYMYVVMNLENFARSVNWSNYHTYGYFTFDFIVSITGLEKWMGSYFGIDRTPYLISPYNTYTAFWWFYSDFGVVGLALIPLLLGLSIGVLYYRMRSGPTIKNVTAYGAMVFVMFISYFNFPMAYLWFEGNMLALYWFLRMTMIPRTRSQIRTEFRGLSV